MNSKPSFAPDAIATEYGWAHSKTGELLVAIRGLENPVKGYKCNQPFVLQTEVVIESQESIAEIEIEISPVTTPLPSIEIEIPVKRRPGRPPKKKD
jgi:hypothetical protein